jgi:hypothetical protein
MQLPKGLELMGIALPPLLAGLGHLAHLAGPPLIVALVVLALLPEVSELSEVVGEDQLVLLPRPFLLGGFVLFAGQAFLFLLGGLPGLAPGFELVQGALVAVGASLLVGFLGVGLAVLGLPLEAVPRVEVEVGCAH